jgi:hypothetical protein
MGEAIRINTKELVQAKQHKKTGGRGERKPFEPLTDMENYHLLKTPLPGSDELKQKPVQYYLPVVTRMDAVLDEEGQPVLDEDGNPVMKEVFDVEVADIHELQRNYTDAKGVTHKSFAGAYRCTHGISVEGTPLDGTCPLCQTYYNVEMQAANIAGNIICANRGMPEKDYKRDGKDKSFTRTPEAKAIFKEEYNKNLINRARTYYYIPMYKLTKDANNKPLRDENKNPIIERYIFKATKSQYDKLMQQVDTALESYREDNEEDYDKPAGAGMLVTITYASTATTRMDLGRSRNFTVKTPTAKMLGYLAALDEDAQNMMTSEKIRDVYKELFFYSPADLAEKAESTITQAKERLQAMENKMSAEMTAQEETASELADWGVQADDINVEAIDVE